MPEEKSVLKWVPVASLALALVAVLLIYLEGGDPMDHLKIVAGYTILILVFFFGLMVLIAMATGKIDLTFLVSDADTGHASMARFQLLIFSFVIALSLFVIVVGNKPLQFPAIPNQILTLLGISATTYAVGKGLQMSGGAGSQPPADKTPGGEGAPAEEKKP